MRMSAKLLAHLLPDCACFLEEIATQYDSAEKITLVTGNLNTHKPGSFYETFPSEKAKALWDSAMFNQLPCFGVYTNSNL